MLVDEILSYMFLCANYDEVQIHGHEEPWFMWPLQNWKIGIFILLGIQNEAVKSLYLKIIMCSRPIQHLPALCDGIQALQVPA